MVKQEVVDAFENISDAIITPWVTGLGRSQNLKERVALYDISLGWC